MTRVKFFLAVFLLMTSAAAAQAEPTPGESELNRAYIQIQRKALIESNMQMDAATARIFWPLYNDYMAALQKPNERIDKMLTTYAGNWYEVSDEEAKTLVADYFSIKEELLKVKKSHAKKFSKALPPKVVARFFQIENKLEAVTSYELAQKVPLVH